MASGSGSNDVVDELALVNALFDSQTCKYKFSIKHDPNKDDYDIPINLDSTAMAPFPCELHELAYVLPNATFLGSGSTFEGRPTFPTLSGGRKNEVSGLVVKAADAAVATGGERAEDAREERFLTIPKHSYAVNTTGLTDFACQLSKNDTAVHLGGSEDATLFASSAVRAFLAEALRRTAWMQTERSGTYRPLKLVSYNFRPGTLDPVARTVSTDDDAVPYSVDFKHLAFEAARGYASDTHRRLEDQRERAIYRLPNEGTNLFSMTGDWSTPAIRAIVDARLARWQATALDRSETLRLRSAATIKGLGARNSSRNQDDGFKPLKQSKNATGGNDGARSANPNPSNKKPSVQVVAPPPVEKDRLKKPENKSTHTFFHTAGRPTDDMQTRMLLKTTINYANRRPDRSLEAAQKSTISIRKNVRWKGGARVVPALVGLNLAFSQIPVFDPGTTNTFAINSDLFRRVAFLLAIPVVRAALAQALVLATEAGRPSRSSGPARPTKLTLRNDDRYEQAAELLVKMRSLSAELGSSASQAISTSPEREALNAILGLFENVGDDVLRLLKNEARMNDATETAPMMIDTDGFIEIVVQTSAHGETPQSLNPAPAAYSRGEIIAAVARAVLRIFYEPDPEAMERYFPRR